MALLFSPTLAHAKDKPRIAPVPKRAAEYPDAEFHLDEHVTLAAIPCDNPKDCPFFRNEYVQHSLLPVWVVISNDRDQPLVLDDARIQLLPKNFDRIQAATQDDLQRRLFSMRQARGTKLPLGITIHHEPTDDKITNDDTDFGFKSLTVEPHTTAAGYVFYDVSGLGDDILKGAELLVKEISTTNEKGTKLQLFAFTISFDKWLAANPPLSKR